MDHHSFNVSNPVADPEGVRSNPYPCPQFLNIQFHFHGIFKKNEIKPAKRTPSSTHLSPPPSRNPGSAPETRWKNSLVLLKKRVKLNKLMHMHTLQINL